MSRSTSAPSGLIAKRQIRDLDRAARRRQMGARQALALGRAVEDVAQPLHRNLHLLEILPQLRQPQDRRRGLVHDHVEGDQAADRQVAVDHRLGAEEQHRGGRRLVDILNGVLAEIAQHHGLERRLHVGGEPVFPFVAQDRLDRRGLQGLDAEHRFDQELLASGAGVEALIDLFAQCRTDQKGDQQINRNRDQHDEGQCRRIKKHDGDEDDREQQIDCRRQPLSGQKAADGLELAHAGDRLACGAGFEISERQPQQMIEQAAAELDVDAARGVAECIGRADIAA